MNILNAILSQAIFGQTEVTASDLDFRGIYNASGGVAPTPLTKGHYYVISNGGTIGGTVYNANDFIWCNGTIWQRTPALLTGVTLVNGQTGNVVLDTDDITEGVNKYVTASDIVKLANIPLNTNLELAKMFDKTANTTDNITVGLTNLFLTALERAKLVNVPNDTNTALNSKYTLLSNTMDDIINGTTYVKTENNFTDAYKNKLDNLTDNYKGSYADDTALKTAYPTGNEGDYATVQSTGTIWIWSAGLSDWADTLSGSIGDMLKADFSPSGKVADVFDMDNMDDGTTKVAMLLTERTKLSGLDAGDKLTVTAVEKSNIATITDKVTLEEAQDAVGLILTDTNTIDFTYDDVTPTIEADLKYQNSDTTTISDDLNGLKVDVEDNTSIQKVEIAKAGTLTGSRKRVNLIEGSNITITTTDNAVDDRVDLTITSNAVSGTIAVQKDDVEVVASVETLNFEGAVTVIDEGSNKVTVTVTGGSGTDELVKISSNDTAAGYLEDKVVGTTNKITVTTLNDGGNEDLQIGIGTDIFDKSTNTMDNITDGTTYVKTTNDYTDAEKTKLANINNPMLFKGGITLNSDFPTLAEVENGWTYTILADVTDNDATKTNTSQSFLINDEIAWNGVNWTILGSVTYWNDNGTDLTSKVDTRNINLQNGGLKDTNVTTAVKLGDAGNTSFNTTNKTIIGAVNEVLTTISTETDTFNIETKVLDTFVHASYTGAVYNYNITNGTIVRTGQIFISTNGTVVNFGDNSIDLGDSSGVTFNATINGANVELSITSDSTGWTIKYTKQLL
jgi:hypothetical protein